MIATGASPRSHGTVASVLSGLYMPDRADPGRCRSMTSPWHLS